MYERPVVRGRDNLGLRIAAVSALVSVTSLEAVLRGDAAEDVGNPPLERLDLDDGRRLLALQGELVWASTVMVEANQVVAPRVGLPALPLVDWPDDQAATQLGVHWKTAPLARWAAGRAFAWLDDEITDADQRWVGAHHP